MSAIDSLYIAFNSILLAFFLCFWSLNSQNRSVSKAEELSYSSSVLLSSRPPRPFIEYSSLPPGDVQCVTRPSGCSLSCPGGYEGALASAGGQLRCLCQCRLPIQTTNCQSYGPLFCRPNDRCINQNGQIKCVSTTAPNAEAANGAAHRQIPNAVLPVNVTPLRPSLPIRTLGKHLPSDENEDKYATWAGKTEAKNIGAKGREGHDDDDQCDGITCDESALHQCQLVESDCDNKTTERPQKCPPVAKCLINPCPHGKPIRLPNNGVTALCREDGQCLGGWCHKIGYNGFGFCCPLPIPSLTKNGQCKAKQTKKRTMAWELSANCSAECRWPFILGNNSIFWSDSDCILPSAKCCFDGCGMSCQLTADGYANGEQNIGTKAAQRSEEEEKQSSGEGEAIVRPPTKAKKPSTECPSTRDHSPMECAEERGNECLEDTNCAGEMLKCCSDGCSLRCIDISSNVSLSLPNGSKAKNGPIDTGGTMSSQCPRLPLSYRTQFCPEGQKSDRDECEKDSDCSDGLKCCVGFCNRRQCFYPSLEGNFECVARMVAVRIVAEFNADNKRIFEPKCDAKGQFAAEQTDGQFTFCVDRRGNELTASRRLSDQFIACDQKKSCPSSIHCLLKCPFGFQFDSEGCTQCECRESPCNAIKCPKDMVCKMVPYKCLIAPSNAHLHTTSESSCAVPECLPNVCMRGEPMEDTNNGQLVQCDEKNGIKCPSGWHCLKMGIGPMGFCCSGMVLHSELFPSSTRCPAAPNLSYKMLNSAQTLACRLSRECPSRQICCFDGASTRCLALSAEKRGEMGQSQIGTNGGQINVKRVRQLDVCPLRLLSNASTTDCASECATDADCARRSAFLRCCPVGCGTRCQFGNKLTRCVHLLATNLREVDKLVQMPKSVGRPTVQCTEQGLFEKVQFDPINGQFWCVDPLTGVEAVGSRISASPFGPVSPPDCNVHHFCKFNCSASKDCLHGFRMDHRGCPIDEKCQCRNPCEDFKCSFPDKEICLLKMVECIDETFCPPIPICVENVCHRFGFQSVGDFVCSSATDCQKDFGNFGRVVECKFGSSKSRFDRIGICCASAGHLAKEQSNIADVSTTISAISSIGADASSIGADASSIGADASSIGADASSNGADASSIGADASSIGADASSISVADVGVHKEKTSYQVAKQQQKQGLCPAGGAEEVAKAKGHSGQNEKAWNFLTEQQSAFGDCSDLCSTDSECAGIQKCCPKSAGGCRQCVQPILTTNCLNLLSAVLSLDDVQIQHSVPKPNCDPKTGAFSRVQCDGQGWCWCVASASTGTPLLGTRIFQPIGGQMFCEMPKSCPLQKCSAIRCPFGVQVDLDGCPLSSDCRCRSPCDQIQCPNGQICLLRPRDCVEAEQSEFGRQIGTFCLPVPTCEVSPCGGVLKPLLNSAFLVPQKCDLNTHTRQLLPQCPASFQCIGHGKFYSRDTTPPAEGICCPREEIGGDWAVESDLKEKQNSKNAKANFCYLPVHQGSNVEECGVGRSELRHFYDSQREKCEEFLFSGCGGNGNNFKSESECQKKCEVVGNILKENVTQNIEIGFLFGQNGHFSTMESALRDYLQRAFDLAQGQIRNVRIDQPTKGQAHFTISAPDARKKAKLISEAISLGHFQFPLDDGQLVAAKSQGFWTNATTADEDEGQWQQQQQEHMTQEANAAANLGTTGHISLFWVLLFSVLFFAVVVLLVPSCAFLYLWGHPRVAFGRNSVIEGEDSFCSPSPRARAPTQHNWSPMANQRKDGMSTTPTVLMEDAEERGYALRGRPAAIGAGMPSDSMLEYHLPIASAAPSSTSPAISSTASSRLGGAHRQRIIAPRILTEQGEEEEQIRRGERTSTRTTWRWRT